MINRWLGIATFAIMASVNAALFLRDILPGLLAGEPPPPQVMQLPDGYSLKSQAGIFNQRGERMGYVWTIAKRDLDLLSVQNCTVLGALHLPAGLSLPSLRIDTVMQFKLPERRLDRLLVQVMGLGVPIRLEGEFYPPDDFPCQWQVSDQRGSFVLTGISKASLGEALRPFDSLTGLEVGQSWRIELLDPLTGILPGLGRDRMLSRDMLVRVTARETIEHGGRRVEAFRVEGPALAAWVAEDGQVLRQTIRLPLLGEVMVEAEEYDEELRQRVSRDFMSGGLFNPAALEAPYGHHRPPTDKKRETD